MTHCFSELAVTLATVRARKCRRMQNRRLSSKFGVVFENDPKKCFRKLVPFGVFFVIRTLKGLHFRARTCIRTLFALFLKTLKETHFFPFFSVCVFVLLSTKLSRRGGPLSRPPAGCALGSVAIPVLVARILEIVKDVDRGRTRLQGFSFVLQ